MAPKISISDQEIENSETLLCLEKTCRGDTKLGDTRLFISGCHLAGKRVISILGLMAK